MAKTPKNPGLVDLDDPMFDDPDGLMEENIPVTTPRDPGEVAEEKAVARLMEELGTNSEASVSVHRARNGRATGVYLFRFHPLERKLPDVLDELRDEYGSGEYQLVISDGSKVVPGGRRNVAVEAKKSAVSPALQPTPPASQGNDLATLLQVMREEARQRDDQLQKQYERDREREEARMEREQARMMEFNKMMLSNLNPKKDDSFDKFITVIQTKFMQDMMGEKKSPLSQIKEIIEVSSLIGGGGGGEESVLQTALKTIGPSIGKVAEAVALQAKLQAGSTPAPLPVKPNPVAKDAPAQLPPPPPPAEEDFKVLIRMIERGAAQDKDPVTYAELILDQIGPDMAKQLFSDPKAVEAVMGQINPEILAARQEWFGELIEVVLELLSPETDDGEAPPVENDESAPAVPDTGTDTGTQPTD